MKPIKFKRRMSVVMWLSITFVAVSIALLFWGVLETSLRVRYKDENMEALDRVVWSALRKYGEPDFESNLRFLSGSEEYFIRIIKEKDYQVQLSLDNQGEDNNSWIPELDSGEIFNLLDESEGYYSFFMEDSIRNVEWAVEAVVLANRDGYREVLVMTKSLANVDYLIHLLYTRIVFALIVAVVMAAIASFFITGWFSGPVVKLTRMAEKMAKGDYNLSFPKGGFYEVNQLSETLNLAADEFKATEELRREFVANISHDMKTPLTVIRMYAEMIQTMSGDNKEKREVHLKQIISETEKLTGFINDTMELAKLQSGTMIIKYELFDLSNLLQTVLESFEVHQELAGFDIDLDMDESFYVSGDRGLIGRVLENLLSNAVKFSGETKKIMVSAVKEDGMALVSVRDYGVGIAADQLPYIWDRYYKIETYGSAKSSNGVGLHIVKEILTQHDSKFGVESEVGKGSRFWFQMKVVEK